MAILLYLYRQQYFEGSVRVFRGDAWDISGQVVDQVGGVQLPVDLTGAGVTGYFPSASGGDPIAVEAVVANAEAGSIRIPVSDDVTPEIQENVNGIQLYVVVDGAPSGEPYTAQMPNPDLQIVSRGFQDF